MALRFSSLFLFLCCLVVTFGLNLIIQNLGCQDDKCLILYQTKLNNQEANHTCTRTKAGLLTLTSHLELSEVGRTLDTFGIKRAWLGARFKSTSGIPHFDCGLTRNRKGPRCGTFNQNFGCKTLHETVCAYVSINGKCRKYFDQLHGYCVFLNKTRVTWYRARQICLSLAADLVTSDSYLYSYLKQGDRYTNLERMLSSIRHVGTRSGRRRLLGVVPEDVTAGNGEEGSGGSGDDVDDLRRARPNSNKGRKPAKLSPWTRCVSHAWIWDDDKPVDLQQWAGTGPGGAPETCLTMNRTEQGEWLLQATRCGAFSSFICQREREVNNLRTTSSSPDQHNFTVTQVSQNITTRIKPTLTDRTTKLIQIPTSSVKVNTGPPDAFSTNADKVTFPSVVGGNTVRMQTRVTEKPRSVPRNSPITVERITPSSTPSSGRQTNTVPPKNRVRPEGSTTPHTAKAGVTDSSLNTGNSTVPSTTIELHPLSTKAVVVAPRNTELQIGVYAAIVVSVLFSLLTVALVTVLYVRIRMKRSKRKQNDHDSNHGGIRGTDNMTVDDDAVYATIDNDTSPHLSDRTQTTPDIVNSCSVQETSFTAAPYPLTSRRDVSVSQRSSQSQPSGNEVPYSSQTSRIGEPHSSQTSRTSSLQSYPGGYREYPHPSIRGDYSSDSATGVMREGSRLYPVGSRNYPHTGIHGQSSIDSGVSLARDGSTLSGSTYRDSQTMSNRPDYMEVLPDTKTERRYRNHVQHAQSPHNFTNYTYQKQPEHFMVSQPPGGDSWSWHNTAPPQQQHGYHHRQAHDRSLSRH